MRVLRLPRVTELGDGALLALGDEDRVVAEASAATRLGRDPSLENARTAQLFTVWSDRDELGHVARTAIVDPFELPQELRDCRRTLGCVARGLDAGPATERRDLEAGVLADRPAVGNARAAECRLDLGVAVVRVARLR